MKGIFKHSTWMLVCIICLGMVACDSTPTYAPVSDVNTIEPLPASGVHRVTPGETLYEIAWRYGLDYRYLAALNHLSPPYYLRKGQTLYLRNKINLPNKKMPALVVTKATPPMFKPIIEKAEPTNVVSKWVWPAKGKVITPFSVSHKGINIAGREGEPIVAVAAGKVVYAGDGLRTYGNLIIIKHNSLYLSAYAHNKELLVKEGEWVQQGQKIAEMGHTGTDRVILHFEMRRAGKPIDPVSLYQ